MFRIAKDHVVVVGTSRANAELVTIGLHVCAVWQREGRGYVTGVLTTGENAGALRSLRTDRIAPFRFEGGKAIANESVEREFEADIDLVVMPGFSGLWGFVEDVAPNPGKRVLCTLQGGVSIDQFLVDYVEIDNCGPEELKALNKAF